MATVTISPSDLKQITMVVGSILVELETNGQPLLYSDPQILDIAVLPALELYFSKFPIEVNYETAIGSDATLTIPFPDINTFGVTHISVVNRTGGSRSNSGFFWDEWRFNQQSYSYGSKKNINGSRHLRHLQRAEMDTLSNEGTYRYNIDKENRKITVFSDFSGNVSLTWAKLSYNFDSVKFDRKREVIDLARGYLQQHTGEMLGLIPDLGANIDVDAGALKDSGTENIERVLEKWDEIPKVAVLRT